MGLPFPVEGPPASGCLVAPTLGGNDGDQYVSRLSFRIRWEEWSLRWLDDKRFIWGKWQFSVFTVISDLAPPRSIVTSWSTEDWQSQCHVYTSHVAPPHCFLLFCLMKVVRWGEVRAGPCVRGKTIYEYQRDTSHCPGQFVWWEQMGVQCQLIKTKNVITDWNKTVNVFVSLTFLMTRPS